DFAADRRHTCLCRLDEAEILLEIGDLGECIASAREARRLGRTLELNFEIGKSLLFEAAALKRAGRNAEAEPLLTEAKRRFELETNNVWTAILRLQTVLLAQTETGPEMLTDALAAHDILDKSGLAHHQAFADIVIGRLELASGHAERAIESFRHAVLH